MAIEKRDHSLLESLVRRLGEDSRNHPNLVSAAIEQSVSSPLLRNALAQAGLLPPEVNEQQRTKREKSGYNLFKAIRRNDVKAVQALLAKHANLSIVDEEGRTALELATSLGRDRLAQLIGAKLLSGP
jgi:hypothetical protein